MKEYDDTEIEEVTTTEVLEALTATLKTFRVKIVALEKRVASLEARKPPQDTNPDPEWYS